ncbi:PA14 domain-containing protein [Streptomyces sp. ACT015]|uniref:PA14 domain-containing protein n=1 Tax=Streptomyces sp. ACT015 TaxID=3134807 RepID=UPI003D16F653
MNPARRPSAAAATAVVLATAGGLLTVGTVPASAAATCTSPVFKRQFYANTTFSGTPRKTDCDAVIDQSWSGAPAAGLRKDNFGVRWTLTRDFGSGGPFTLSASGLDGIRVHLDGVRRIDLWKNVSSTVAKSVDVTVPKGKHTLRIDYVNWTGSAKIKVGYAPRTAVGVDKVKPLVPTGTSLAHDSAHRVRFGWSANKEMDLAGYRVYRRLKGTSFGAEPLATTTSTAYTDTTLPKNGAVYFYEVRAYDKAGNESAGTADLSVTTADTLAPATPTGVGGWRPDHSRKAQLSWSANTETDLAGYHVYRSTTGRPVPLTAANRVSGDKPLSTTWFEQPLPQTGDVHLYVVTAVDTHGNESAASSVVEFYTLDTTGPVDTAHHARAVEDERGVTLTWDRSQTTSPDFAGYTVVRGDRPVGQSGRAWEVVGKGIRGTSFTDKAPPPGATYSYSVMAVDGAGNSGVPSVEMPVTVAGNSTPPPAVTGMSATARENGVDLSWDASDDPGLDHYLVLRGTLVDGAWVYEPLIDGWTHRPAEFTGTQHFRTDAADGERLRYSVVAVDQYGNRLAPGSGAAVLDVTELDLRPDDGASPAVGGNPIAGLSGGIDGVLRWWTSGDARSYGTVTGYAVHRWNRTTRVFDRVDVLTVHEQAYRDSALPRGTTTYYRVTAILADGTETAASEAAVAWLD